MESTSDANTGGEPADQANELSDREIQDDGQQVVGPLHPGDRCPIGWQPNALAPVFYGVRDMSVSDGAPMPLRLFFPSLEGAVWSAPILKGCGRYPVVVFCHGYCPDDHGEHYKQWFELPRRLAKSGYVVLVPRVSLTGIESENPSAFADMTALLQWVRETWEHRALLLPSPATALIGHSWGGLLVGRFAAVSSDIAAFVSLSSGWEHDFPALALELERITVPKLFVGGNEDPASLLSGGLWASLPAPKHRATFAPFAHWDYLPQGSISCCRQSACSQLPGAVFDVVAMFLANYLPPEFAQDLPHRVPDSLTPPMPLPLTIAQEFYAGGNWLTAMAHMKAEPECEVSLDWDTPDTRIVPHVRLLPANLANQLVRARDLRPAFTGPNHTNSWVASQAPAAGRRALVGDTVTMQLRSGPIP
jgi:pimeloyl-ACP methyl ester carboxylesterase